MQNKSFLKKRKTTKSSLRFSFQFGHKRILFRLKWVLQSNYKNLIILNRGDGWPHGRRARWPVWPDFSRFCHQRLLRQVGLNLALGLVTSFESCHTGYWGPARCWLGWGSVSVGDPSKSHYGGCGDYKKKYFSI